MCKYGGTRAEALKTAINDLLTNEPQIQDYHSKVVSMTTDGASVNRGTKSGLLTRMKNDDRPWLIPVYCVNHKIELAVKDTFEAAGFTNVDNLYQTIFYLLKTLVL